MFSSTLQQPLKWANTRLITGGAVEAVRALKAAGLVDQYRVVVFPAVMGATGS